MPKIDPLIKERVIRAFLNTEMPSILMTVGCDRMEKELSVHIMAIFSLLLRSIVSKHRFWILVYLFSWLWKCRYVQVGSDSRRETARRGRVASDNRTRQDRYVGAQVTFCRFLINFIIFRSQLSTSRTHLGANYALKNAALNPGKDLLVQK